MLTVVVSGPYVVVTVMSHAKFTWRWREEGEVCQSESFIFLTHVLMFELFMYVYSCNALSARFFDVDRALNSYFYDLIRRSNRLWAGLSCDLVIEQTMMCAGKSTGGLTEGRGMHETMRTTWTLDKHADWLCLHSCRTVSSSWYRSFHTAACRSWCHTHETRLRRLV